MSSQLEDFYDFYDEIKNSSSKDETKVSQDYHNNKVLSSYLDSLMIVSLVIFILLLIKFLSYCIQQKKASMTVGNSLEASTETFVSKDFASPTPIPSAPIEMSLFPPTYSEAINLS